MCVSDQKGAERGAGARATAAESFFWQQSSIGWFGLFEMEENFVIQTWKSSVRKKVPSLVLLSVAKVYLQVAVVAFGKKMFLTCSGQLNALAVLSEDFGDLDSECTGSVSFWQLIQLAWSWRKENGGIEFKLPLLTEKVIGKLEIPETLKEYFRCKPNDICNNKRKVGNLILWNSAHTRSTCKFRIVQRLKRLSHYRTTQLNQHLDCPFGFKEWGCICVSVFVLKMQLAGRMDFYAWLGGHLEVVDDHDDDDDVV